VAVIAQKQLDGGLRNLLATLSIYFLFMRKQNIMFAFFSSNMSLSPRGSYVVYSNRLLYYEQMGRANKAENMYLRALHGLEAVLGRLNKRCQDIIAALAALQGDRG
jgi:hypothetical protein